MKPWGSINIYLGTDSPDTSTVLENLEKFYAENSMHRIPWEEVSKVLSDYFEQYSIEGVTCKEGLNIDQDEVIWSLNEDTGWIALKSHKFEWTLPGKNPLALFLSKTYQVFVVAASCDDFSEFSLYANGTLKNYTKFEADNNVFLERTVPFDMNWFQGKGSLATENDLKRLKLDCQELMKLLGPDDEMGFEYALESAPMQDYGPDHYYIFRKNDFKKIGRSLEEDLDSSQAHLKGLTVNNPKSVDPLELYNKANLIINASKCELDLELAISYLKLSAGYSFKPALKLLNKLNETL